jgi:hypothetical protein
MRAFIAKRSARRVEQKRLKGSPLGRRDELHVSARKDARVWSATKWAGGDKTTPLHMDVQRHLGCRDSSRGHAHITQIMRRVSATSTRECAAHNPLCVMLPCPPKPLEGMGVTARACKCGVSSRGTCMHAQYNNSPHARLRGCGPHWHNPSTHTNVARRGACSSLACAVTMRSISVVASSRLIVILFSN